MRFVLRLILFAAVLTIPFAIPANAQYMYLDSNANGVHDSADRLNPNGTATTVDLYVITNQNRDGSTAVCDSGPELLTINQYQINLLAVGGTVTYAGFINQQAATMTFGFGELNPDGIRYKNGFGGGTQLAVGMYKLCTLTITGATGTPRIDVVDQVTGSPDFTGFGTSCVGRGFDNVYRLDGPNVPPATGDVGDFTDADGLAQVAGGNTPPAVTNPGNRTVNELATLAFTATATDPDAGQTITWALTVGTPAATGATLGASTGAFSWTPTEAQGPGVYPVTITAADNATPTPGTGEAAFTITVNELNAAPVLAAIGNKTVDELATLTFTATATDADLPPQIRSFSLDIGAPSGATISTGGVFSWTPTESDGPGTFPITVRVADTGTPSLDDSETITVTVNEANLAPVLAAIGPKTVTVSTALTFTATATDADLPANTLSFSLDAGAPAGATIGSTTGAFSWTPAATGTFPVTVRVTDNGTPALSDFEAVIVTVTPGANVAPVLGAIGNKTVAEQTLLAFTATATDDASQTLTFSLDAGAPAGAAITAGGAFSWTPTEAQGPGTFPVTIRVTDDATPALDDFEAIAITVNEVNVAPVLGAIGNMSGTVGVQVTFTATATDADLPANTLAFSLDAGAPTGAAIIAATGVFTWIPVTAQVGTSAVTVRVTDNGTPPLSDSETIMINIVGAPNQAPVLGAIGDKTVNENAILSFTATATDADGSQTMTFSLDAGAPAGATINSTSGGFLWQPIETDGPGVYPITVRVTDNGTPPMSDAETIQVTVNEVNIAPVLNAIGNKTVDELVNLNFTATATDADLPANTLAFSLGAGAPTGAVITTGGVFSWTPTEAQGPGSYPVTIRVTEDSTPPLDDFEAISITVNDVNSAPVLAPIGNQATTVGVAVTFTATATDTDIPANSLAFSLDAGAPSGATIDPTTGAFSYTPAANGTFPVTVRVTDDGTPALSDFEAISIVVSAAPNQEPVLGAIGNKTVNEEANLGFTATATDPDAGSTLTFSLDAGSPPGAGIDGPSGAFSWTPTEGQGPGTFPITVRVTDDGTPNLSDSEAITVTVNEVNVAPALATIGDRSGSVGVEVAFTAAAIDDDLPANALAFSLDTGAPAGATIDPTTGAFSWTPSAAGSFPVTVRVTDDGTPSLDDFEVIAINVSAAANQPPVLAAIGDKTVNEEALLSFTATATDPDAGQTATFSLDAGAPSGAAITAGGDFSWTPTEAQGPGSYPVTVRVTDNGSPALDDFEAISITVNEVNLAPVLAAIGDKSGSVGVEVAFTATATDADLPANALAFSLDAGAPAGATINATTGAFSWTPSGAGSFPVTVRVTDDGTPSLDDFEAIAINVSAAANEPPVLAAIGDKTVDELALLSFTATATDPDAGQTLTFSLDAGAPSGAAITAGGVFSWTPTEIDGPDAFPITVRVTDNGSPALSDFEAISVTVNEVNEAPALAAIGNKGGSVGAAISFKATATDNDIPTNEMAFSLDAGAPAGATLDSTTGDFSWTPPGAGSFQVIVRVTDNGIPALDDFEEITINVVDTVPEQPPVLAAIGDKTVDELSLLSFTATATDPNAGQTLTFSLDAGAPAGAAITAGGVFSWTPAEIDGPDTFPITVRVTDNGSLALDDSEAITVTVNEVNEAPTLAAIGNKGGIVGAAISFKATATDNDIPTNEMTFSLDAGAPAGATIDPTTGDFSWTPPGAGSFQVIVRVTDNGIPAFSDFEEITINVEEVVTNQPPVLAAIGSKTVDEQTLLSFTATATDPDAGQTLTFSLDAGAPSGATITAGGAFSWTPTEAQGPGSYPITVRVTDNGTPALSDFEAITVTVNEVNVAPVLAAIGNKTGTVGALVSFTASATDADIPANTLTFSLDSGAPSGATIGASSGVFNWTPAATGVFSVTVRVTDNGTPSLSDFETIQITVGNAQVLQAHAFFFGLNLLTILESRDPFTCVQIEPVKNSYSNSDVDLSSIIMKYRDKQITANVDRTDLDGDKNRNRVREIKACFSKPDLRYLFGDLRRGLHRVEVTIEGQLVTGATFRDKVDHFVLVIGNRCDLVASPNPLNPETVLHFTTTQSGPVTIRVFDIAGRLVKTLHDGTMPAGFNSIRWDGSTESGNRVATGVYFVKMKSIEGDQNLRVTVLK